jgi:hypothetical protein
MPFEPSSHDAQAASKVDTARPACPLCATPAAQSFFEQKGIPIHENVLMLSREEARACPRGDLAVALCSLCGQIFNAAFDYPGVRFSAEYNNAQTYSPRYLDYLEELASDLIQRHALRGKAIVEIGCGQGWSDCPGTSSTKVIPPSPLIWWCAGKYWTLCRSRGGSWQR